MTILKLLILVCLYSSLANADPSQVRLIVVQGSENGAVYAIKWDAQSCKATRGMQDPNKLHFESVSIKPCEKVKSFLALNQGALKNEAIKGNKLNIPEFGPYGVVRFGKMNFIANLMTEKTCDSKMQNCKDPVLSVASQLAKVLRKAISEEWDKP